MRAHWPILSVRVPPELLQQIDHAAARMFCTYPRDARRGERSRYVVHALRSFTQGQRLPRAGQTKGA
jgi:hypothetical protein